MYTEYSLNTSAIYPLPLELRERFIDHTHKPSALDSTIYEAGNTLLREFKRGRISFYSGRKICKYICNIY